MIIPIGHEEMSVRRLPWVTIGIMATCVAAFVYGDRFFAGPETFWARWGLIPAHFTLLTDFTHMFLHAGWGHLVGNLFMLFLVGPPIEDRWGRPLFAGFYVAAGLLSGGFYALLSASPELPLVGASGAIAAVMGACLVLYWSTQIRFFYFLWLRNGTFHAPAYAMLPLWFASEVFMASFTDWMDVTTGIAYWAHVGGFAFGVATAFGMRHWRVEERFIHDSIESRITVAANPALDEALALRENGDDAGALMRLEAAVAERPDDADLIAALWDTACACSATERVAPSVVAFATKRLNAGESDLAASTWSNVLARVPGIEADPRFLLLLAPVYQAGGDPREAARAVRHAVAQRALSPGMALKAVELARDLHPPTALAAARRALETDGLHQAKRDRIETLVAELEARSADAEALDLDTGVDRSIAIEPDDDLAPPELARPAVAQPEPLALDADGAVSESEAAGDLSGGELVDVPPPPPVPASALAPPPVPPPPPGGDPRAEARALLRDLPPPPASAGAIDDIALQTAAEEARFASVKVIEAVPTELAADYLGLQQPCGKQGKLGWQRIQAIAVGAVRGMADKPVIVIDLVANWNGEAQGPLRALRLRSDGFDAQPFFPMAENSLAAFRALLDALLDRSGGLPLPDRDAARGRPFRTFDDLEGYQREVLRAAS